MGKVITMKLTKKIFILFLLSTIIIGGSIVLSLPITAQKNTDDPSNIINKYLEVMTTGNFEKDMAFFANVPVGMKPYITQTYSLPLEEAEKKGLVQKGKVDYVSILNEQRDFVISLFGEDAWLNTEYSLEKVNSPEVKEQWIEKSTKKIISEETGLSKLKNYWDKISEKEGINPEELFSHSKLASGKITNEKALKLKKIKDKYQDNEPVELQLVPFYELYKVNLTFNGADTAETGESNFYFYISNKHDKWSMFDGLHWNIPFEEPTGDI